MGALQLGDSEWSRGGRGEEKTTPVEDGFSGVEKEV
jgi:hypothetical protein